MTWTGEFKFYRNEVKTIRLFERFRKEPEERMTLEEPEERMTLEDVLLQAGLVKDSLTVTNALNIPSVSACVELISNTVAILPIKLYKDDGVKVDVLRDDNRVNLLNEDTGDTLDGFQFKKALVEDYLLEGAGYAYINRDKNNVKSIHYVDHRNIAVNMSTDPILKHYDILVNGQTYRDFEFIKITRKTKDGVTGKGIVKENKEALSVLYNSIIYENILVKTGGNKKGFLKSQKKLSKDGIDELKRAWNNMYKNNTENVIVLNEGLDFQEASNTSVEMQLNEHKKTNSNGVAKIFNVPQSLLEGSIKEDGVYDNFIKLAILPILNAIEVALNKDLLLPSEKDKLYFKFDTNDLLKADMEKRYKAYELGIKNGVLQTDEVRYMENLEPLDLDFVKIGLQDVLYFPKTKQIYTPNTNQTVDMDNLEVEQGVNMPDRNKEKNNETPLG